MAQRLQLNVQKRETTGKKVKKLRKEGLIPANIFGKKIKSQNIKAEIADFRKIFKKAGETTIVDLLIGKSKGIHHTLIRHVQTHPVSGEILHVDFMEVDLKEKLETEVPIRLKGESQAALDKQALIQQELNTILIEASADSIPEEIAANIQNLSAVGEAIRVKDLKVPSGVKIKNDPEQPVVRLAPLVKEKKEPEPESAEEEEPKEDKKGEKAETEQKENSKAPEKSEETPGGGEAA